MKNTTTIAILATGISLLVSACTSTESKQTADADGLVCRREVPTGTLKPVTRCRAESQVKKDEADADKTLGFVRQTAPDTPGR